MVLSTQKLEVEENTAEPVSCKIIFEDENAAQEEYTLGWFNEDGSFVSTDPNDGEYQIPADETSSSKDTAILVVSGKGTYYQRVNAFQCSGVSRMFAKRGRKLKLKH